MKPYSRAALVYIICAGQKSRLLLPLSQGPFWNLELTSARSHSVAPTLPLLLVLANTYSDGGGGGKNGSLARGRGGRDQDGTKLRRLACATSAFEKPV